MENENVMRNVKLEKVVFSVGGIGDELEKGVKLLKIITGKKPYKTKTRKRIPGFGIRPGLEIGAMVTIRKNTEEILKKMLAPKDNILRKKSVTENGLSFGIKEYIEIPGVEYQRDLGVRGFDVTLSFKRAGRRVKQKKIKGSKVPAKQKISKEEIIKFMEENFNTKFI